MRSHRSIIVALWTAAAVACNDDVTIPPGGADQTAPQPIDDLTLAYDSLAQGVVFTWTSRRDDLMRDRAAQYDIRYSATLPFDWEHAQPVASAPQPAADGTSQQFTLASPVRRSDIYASVRAVDAAGNVSPAGSVAYARIPGLWFTVGCVDALTDRPVAGLDVAFTGVAETQRSTGSDGRVALDDLPGGALQVAITTGHASPLYHAFTASTTLGGDASVMYEMIPYQVPDSPDYFSILFMLMAGDQSPGGHWVRRWYTLPVQWYAPEFVNGNGLDYRALTAQAAERWNARLGFQLFEEAPSEPEVGILIEFQPRSVMGSINGICEYLVHENYYPIKDRIRIVDDFADGARLYSILMHELGHTLPLGHLGPGFIMYASQPLPSDITDDEVKMVQLMYALPNGTFLEKYDIFPPSPP